MPTTYEVLVAHEYLDLEYEYRCLRFKNKYKFKYQGLKCKYKYLTTAQEYCSSISIRAKYYNSELCYTLIATYIIG